MLHQFPNAPYTVFLLVKHPILGITDVMGIMQPLINDDRFVHTDVAMNGVLIRWEPSRMKISCCYFKQKCEKSLRSFAEPCSCPLRALFNHATKFVFVSVDVDQWFCFCQENNFELTKPEWLLYVLSNIVRSAQTMYLCVLYGSQNKQRLFHSAALTNWFL
jgi:hypothetical protein